MKIEKDEKYWKDYTAFINTVENLTGLSPSDLLTRYEGLISELKDIDEDDYLEWEYEFKNDFWLRREIQSVINHKPISENMLLSSFKENVEILDSVIKRHLLNSDQADWWENPKLKFTQK